MGFEIDALLTGLGIGGIAVALSVQNILGDLFASLSILVGLKTPRIWSLTGEELVVANNDLLRTRIRNYRHMKDRLVNFNLGVTYQTPYAKLKEIPGLIRAVIQEHENGV
ncbi:MAG: hypothetical protein ACOY94_07055 [Bacillota bacterium]